MNKPPWFPEQLPKAKKVAELLPLVRVAVPGAAPRREEELGDLLKLGLLKLTHKSPRARGKEERLQAPDSLYFHAGRTHPDYGDFVVALEGPLEKWEASPSGLGSLLCDQEPHDPTEVHEGCLAPVAHRPLEQQQYHYKNNNWTEDWCSKAGGFLATYFGQNGLARYFAPGEEGRPDLDDPDQIFHNHNVKDWRAWTIEVRATTDVDLGTALDQRTLLWWGISQKLRREIERRTRDGEEFSFYERLCRETKHLQIEQMYGNPCEIFELADQQAKQRVCL